MDKIFDPIALGITGKPIHVITDTQEYEAAEGEVIVAVQAAGQANVILDSVEGEIDPAGSMDGDTLIAGTALTGKFTLVSVTSGKAYVYCMSRSNQP